MYRATAVTTVSRNSEVRDTVSGIKWRLNGFGITRLALVRDVNGIRRISLMNALLPGDKRRNDDFLHFRIEKTRAYEFLSTAVERLMETVAKETAMCNVIRAENAEREN